MPTPHLRLLFFLIPTFGLLAFSQAQNPLTDSLFLKGNQLWIAGYYDSSMGYYERAEAAARASHNSEHLAYALGAQGRYLSRMGQPDEAIQLLDTALSMVDSLHPVAFLARRDLAHINMLKGKFDEGLVAHQHNADMAEKLPARLDSIKAVCFHVLSNAFFIVDNYEKSKDYCLRAMEIRERILPPNHVYLAFGENSMGNILMWEEKYEESYMHLKRSSDILEHNFGPSHPQVLKIKTNIAIVHTDLGERWKALEIYKECLPHLDKMQPDGAIITLLNMGSNYMTMGDYEEALNTFNLAEHYAQENPNSVPIAESYVNAERAHIYSQLDQHEKALDYIDKAINRIEFLFGKDAEDLLQEFIKKGRILHKLNRFEEASKAFKYAVFLGEKHQKPYALYRAQAYEFYGEALNEEGRTDEARSMLRKAEDAFSGSEVAWNLADVYTKLADTWRNAAQWDSIHYYHKRAWEVIEKKEAYRADRADMLLKHWEMPPVKDMLQSMAETQLAQYRILNKLEYLKQALGSLEASIGVSDSMRHYFETAASRELTMRYLVPEYEQAISLCWDLYSKGAGEQYIDRAFVLAEKSKAANLRDHVRSLSALNFAGLPADLVEKERNFRQQLAELSAPESDAEALSKRRLINVAYRNFLQQIERDYPAYFKLKYSHQSLSPAEILTRLQPGSCMYSYFWGDKQLFIFKLTDHTSALFRVDYAQTAFPDMLQNWLSELTSPEDENSSLNPDLSEALTKLLLPGYHQGEKNLIIIPDGRLSYLPFETLITQKAEPGQYRSWPWLWKESATSYAYAAELWIDQRQQLADRNASEYLGFAPNFGNENFTTTRRAFGPLEFNQYEVTMAAKALNGKALTGTAASEDAIKKLDGSGKILHFATHAIANDSSEMNSRLILAPSADGSEDGQLFAWEIYGLRLASPLTVLSACQTGTGPLRRGEGVMSLARAFQYAGSHRVLTTLWHTDDKASAEISSRFFEAIAAGAATDEALQQARASYLEVSDNAHAHPRYWGAFVMIGDQGNIVLQRNAAWRFWLLGALLTALTAVGLWRENRPKPQVY
ncbi:MAG: CHAT domain-containing protein [Bacteroidia bacterium]